MVTVANRKYRCLLRTPGNLQPYAMASRAWRSTGFCRLRGTNKPVAVSKAH
jgi:hypothetical protein